MLASGEKLYIRTAVVIDAGRVETRNSISKLAALDQIASAEARRRRGSYPLFSITIPCAVQDTRGIIPPTETARALRNISDDNPDFSEDLLSALCRLL